MKNYKNFPEIGKKFGQWTVISETIKSGSIIYGNVNRSSFWRVRCYCGKETWRSANALLRNRTNSCKSCSKTDKFNNMALGYFKRVEIRAKKINVDFDLTIEYIWDLYEKQNKKCALSNIDIHFTNSWRTKCDQTCSLDRIDNMKGYTKNNVQWVHKDINNMKYTFTEEYFINLCKAVANTNKTIIQQTFLVET